MLDAAHNSDFHRALLISSFPLRMFDETIRVAVGLHLARLCEAHVCPCRATVSVRGTHTLSCKWSAERSTRHHINDLTWRARKRSDVPATKERMWLLRDDWKRPDGLSLVSWLNGQFLTWEATLVISLATSYPSSTSGLRRCNFFWIYIAGFYSIASVSLRH